jgi:hypothetical protein
LTKKSGGQSLKRLVQTPCESGRGLRPARADRRPARFISGAVRVRSWPCPPADPRPGPRTLALCSCGSRTATGSSTAKDSTSVWSWDASVRPE